jgi:glycosyltransferase involved in cell wall biosynthesis
VFNGERYLDQALASLVAQTFRDFELIVADNASTDGTAALVQRYAAADPRVRYVGNAVNIGGARNHNRVVELAAGEYFSWAAYDDWRAPEHLERCVAVLDREADVVVAYTGIMEVDATGRPLGMRPPVGGADAGRPSERFRHLTRLDYRMDPMYGVIRLATLRQTALHGLYPDADRVLLTELALRGRFGRVPEPLFFRRSHDAQPVRLYPSRQARAAWFDPSGRLRFVFPHARELWAFATAAWHATVPWRERVACLGALVSWKWRYRRRLLGDVVAAARDLARPLVPGALRRALTLWRRRPSSPQI